MTSVFPGYAFPGMNFLEVTSIEPANDVICAKVKGQGRADLRDINAKKVIV